MIYHTECSSWACAIELAERVIVTGGVRSKRRVTVYNTRGWLEDWPRLQRSRIQHGCGQYVNTQDKMVRAMFSCAANRSIGSTTGFHNNGEGPY